MIRRLLNLFGFKPKQEIDVNADVTITTASGGQWRFILNGRDNLPDETAHVLRASWDWLDFDGELYVETKHPTAKKWLVQRVRCLMPTRDAPKAIRHAIEECCLCLAERFEQYDSTKDGGSITTNTPPLFLAPNRSVQDHQE